MGFHRTLNQIQVDGNPLKTLRRQTIEKGANAIMAWLRERYQQNKDDMVEQWAVDQCQYDVPLPEMSEKPTIEEVYEKMPTAKIGGEQIRQK